MKREVWVYLNLSSGNTILNTSSIIVSFITLSLLVEEDSEGEALTSINQGLRLSSIIISNP